ncbi:MAG: hypothetical protein IIZ24_03130 [Candidatus Methanomethylophilus sp.]|nr:hypothetical protein [Methanomethylophilus sp.]
MKRMNRVYYCPKCGEPVGDDDIASDGSGIIEDVTVLFKCKWCDMRFEIYGCKFHRRYD